MVILESRLAGEAGLGGDVAAAVARGWAKGGARTVLMDLGFENPDLHDRFGVGNGEGVTDFIHYGASLSRIGQVVERGQSGSHLLFASAGTPIVAADSTLRHPRWIALFESVRAEGAKLLLHLPSEVEGDTRILEEADGVVLVTASEEEAATLSDGAYRAIASIGLPPVVPEGGTDEPDVEVTEPEEGARESRGEAEPDTGARVSGEPGPRETFAVGTIEAAAPEEETGESGSEGDEDLGESSGPDVEPLKETEAVRERPAGVRPEKKRRVVPLVILLLLLAGGAVAAQWYGLVEIPGVSTFVGSVLPQRAASETPEVDLTGPVPREPVLRYSLLVDKYPDLAGALRIRDALAERLPELLLIVTPVSGAEGEVEYRLLAGSASTPEEVVGLRVPLSGVLEREDPGAWTVTSTPLAFRMEDVESRDQVERTVAVLLGMEIPAYFLMATFPDGAVKYRVYAGAFAEAEEARALRRVLAANQLGERPLTERRGAFAP